MLVAYWLARGVLPDRTSKFSRKDFTLPQLFACLAPKFFLYVPKECEALARRLLRERGIRPEGLFLFSFTEKNFFIVERAKGR